MEKGFLSYVDHKSTILEMLRKKNNIGYFFTTEAIGYMFFLPQKSLVIFCNGDSWSFYMTRIIGHLMQLESLVILCLWGHWSLYITEVINHIL